MLEPQVITQTELFQVLQQGARLLTGNLRLSRFLSQNFARHAVASEQVVWPTPAIMPLQNWLEQAWETLLINGEVEAEIVLNAQQEALLWEDIIRHSTEGEALLRPHATAQQVQQAWQLLHAWRLENSAEVAELNEDARAFLNWSRQFRACCETNRWLSAAQIPKQLTQAFARNNPFAGQSILLAGFDELTPQQQYLFAALNDSGCQIRWVLPEDRQAEAVLVECADPRDEIKAMARWLRQRLTENPEALIAVVVPNLEQRRTAIVRELSSVLSSAPSAQSDLFNVSLGQALSRYPLIQTAFHLLALSRQRIDLAGAGALLLSPFIAGWENESQQRALLDRRLRETAEPEVSLKTLIYFAAQENQPWYCPVLAEHLRALSPVIDSLPARDRAGRWVEQFSHYLNTAGWSGGRSLCSEEYQTHAAWRELLTSFARLDLIGGQLRSGPMSAQQALGYLRQLANEQTFQPESSEAGVQILGLYEAGGLQFDGLWLMGMNDNIWPAVARPNPFISLALQRQYAMPHATAARELAVARKLTRRLLASAGSIIISYPASGAGAESLRPSTLFNTLARLAPSALALWQGPGWRDLIRARRQQALLTEDIAPAIDFAHEKTGGGSSIIRLQSNCPFRAFAELRLAARPFASVDIGLDPMSRGTLLHRVLELVWDTLETQACLLTLTHDALHKLVADMSRVAIRETQQTLPQQFSGEYLKLEKQRLQDYVMNWLEIEKQRTPFRVLETEQLLETRISGVPIRLKLDRLDALEDGRLLVIDYKTGLVAAGQWFGERPQEPQLPLYASVVQEPLAGILFAQLHAKEQGFKGICEEPGLVPEVKGYEDMNQTRDMPSWARVLTNWKTTVEKLAADFSCGIADVDPLKPGESCRYCELGSLCRIQEQLHEQTQVQEKTGEPRA